MSVGGMYVLRKYRKRNWSEDMEMRDVERERSIEIDGNNEHHPDAVFIQSGKFCIRLDREMFIALVKAEFGIGEDAETQLARILETA